MKRIMWGILPAVFLMSTAATFWAQTNRPDAIYLTAKDIDALVKAKAPAASVTNKQGVTLPGASDVVMRMLPAGAVNMGVSVLQYAKGSRMVNGKINTTEHSDTPELYYVLKGEADFLTGGSISDGKESNNKTLVGPSLGGTAVGGVTHHIVAGDTILVPPNTPHVVTNVQSDIAFLIVRVDTKKQLELK